MQVQIYVDNVEVGEALASIATPHHIVHRLCELDMHIAGDMGKTGLQQGVGFEFKLPELPQGRHQVIHTPHSDVILVEFSGAQLQICCLGFSEKVLSLLDLMLNLKWIQRPDC